MVADHLRTAVFSALVLLASASAHAQQAGIVSGTVRDAATSRPLPGAEITLAGDGQTRTTHADETGAFIFIRTKPGTYALAARRIGYAPWRDDVEITAGGATITITLTRLTTLDTVRVPVGTAIYGVVGAAGDLRLLRGAEVQIAGASVKVTTDSAGRFFAALASPGVYVVRARFAGYASRILSVTVPANGAVEVSLLLDSSSMGASNREEAAWKEFDHRQHLRGSETGLVSRAELLANGNANVLAALGRAASLAGKGYQFGPDVCVFVNGLPSPATSLFTLDASEIEAIEVYKRAATVQTKRGFQTIPTETDLSGTLAARSQGIACGYGQASRPGAENVEWLVIWMKQ
jgi:hypothetical protein